MDTKKNEPRWFWIIGGVLLALIAGLLLISENQKDRLKAMLDSKKAQKAEAMQSRDLAKGTEAPLSGTQAPLSSPESRRSPAARGKVKPKSDADFEKDMQISKVRYRVILDHNYGRLYRKLALPDEKIEGLKDLMWARTERDARTIQENRKNGRADKSADEAKELEKVYLDEIQTFLGADKYPIFKHHVDTVALQATVTATQSLLGPESQISDETADAIVNAMLAAGISSDTMSYFNRDVFRSLSQVLTPQQLEAFKNTSNRFYRLQPDPRD